MIALFVAALVATGVAMLISQLAHRPASNPAEKNPLANWRSVALTALTAGGLFGAFGYLGDMVEERIGLAIIIAALAPLAAAAWEQRFRETGVYRPGSTLSGQEAPDRPNPDVAEPNPVAMILKH